MSGRINDIYYFDYTRDSDYYYAIRDFSSIEMEFIETVVSKEGTRSNASPLRYKIPTSGTEKIREHAISYIPLLSEISEVLAENSPQYLLIRYADGRKIYYKYNAAVCEIFNIAKCYNPQVKKAESVVNTYASQQNGVAGINYTQPPQQEQKPYVAPITSPQQNDIPSPAATSKTDPFPWEKVILSVGIFILLIVFVVNGMKNASVDADLTPVTEPQSGTILSGREVYDGSEITIRAASGKSCVVKLKNRSGTERISFYVRAGDTVTVGVPSEYLYVYFATGDTWYGNTDLFGSKTNYSMDDEIFDFTKYTCEYTLYPVTNGNFSETPIDADDFK